MTTPYEDGNKEASICLIGEAPGRTEIRSGKPFVGPAGQVLEQCLHSAGITRRSCYILNVFDDEVTKTASGEIKDAEGDILWTSKNHFTEKGFERSKGFRDRLSNSSWNVAVPLGGTALTSLWDDERIMKWRGSILTSATELCKGRKLVPTIHPAAALRGQFLYRHYISADLKRAYVESDHPDFIPTKRELLIRPKFSDVMDWIEWCRQKQVFATDIECLNHQVSCFSLAPMPSNSICIPLVGEDGTDYWSEDEEAEIWRRYSSLMSDPEIMKINQNIIFDIWFLLMQNGIFTRGKIGDPMIAHHIIWPDFPKGLDFLCSIHTREPYYKDDGKLWSKPWRDLETFWQYNAKDSACAFEVWEALQKDLDYGYRQTYDDTIRMFNPILFMQTDGIQVDRDKLEQTKVRVGEQLSELYAQLKEEADYEFNPGSPKQCQEYFYIHKGLKPYINRKTGRPTTDDLAMSRIIRRDGLKEAKLVQDIRRLEKLRGTYLEVGIDKDGKLRCSYNPRGTTTGRLSSSQTIFGNGMNMQNLTYEFKEFLVPDIQEPPL